MYSLCSVMILQAASNAQCTYLVSQDCKGSRFIHDVEATRQQIDTRLGKVRCKLFKFKKNSKFHRSGAFLCNLPIKMFRDIFNETLQLLLTGKTLQIYWAALRKTSKLCQSAMTARFHINSTQHACNVKASDFNLCSIGTISCLLVKNLANALNQGSWKICHNSVKSW